MTAAPSPKSHLLDVWVVSWLADFNRVRNSAAGAASLATETDGNQWQARDTHKPLHGKSTKYWHVLETSPQSCFEMLVTPKELHELNPAGGSRSDINAR